MRDPDEDDETLPPEGFDHGGVGPDVPSVEVPGPGPATDPATDAESVDPDPRTARLFWRLVIVFDVALFALAVGPMFWYFEGRTTLALQVTGLGAVAFAYGVYRLRTRETGETGGTDHSPREYEGDATEENGEG